MRRVYGKDGDAPSHLHSDGTCLAMLIQPEYIKVREIQCKRVIVHFYPIKMLVCPLIGVKSGHLRLRVDKVVLLVAWHIGSLWIGSFFLITFLTLGLTPSLTNYLTFTNSKKKKTHFFPSKS